MQRTVESIILEQDIMARGYHEIEHGISDDQIEDLIQRYTDFTTQLPDPNHATMSALMQPGTDADVLKHTLDDLLYANDTQESWHKYRTNVPGIGKPDGYTNRDLQVAALASQRGVYMQDDPKEYYHFTPKHRGIVAEHHRRFGWGAVPSQVDKLDTAFGAIHYRASQLMMRVCSYIEEIHPEIRNVVTKQGMLGSPVRLLFYHPGSSTELAAGHYDKSVLTAQLAESHLGLEVATTKDEPLQPIIRPAQKGVVFVSNTLSAKPSDKNPRGGHFPNSPLRPAWHKVGTSTTANEGRFIPVEAAAVCARWSLIFFVNEHDYIDPGKTAMHTR